MTVLYITAGKGDAPDPNVSQQPLPEEEESEESEGRVFLYKTGSGTPNICKHDIPNFWSLLFPDSETSQKGEESEEEGESNPELDRVISTGKCV